MGDTARDSSEGSENAWKSRSTNQRLFAMMFETAAHACHAKKVTHFRNQCSEITLHKAFASDKFGQILSLNGWSDQKMAQQNYDPET